MKRKFSEQSLEAALCVCVVVFARQQLRRQEETSGALAAAGVLGSAA